MTDSPDHIQHIGSDNKTTDLQRSSNREATLKEPNEPHFLGIKRNIRSLESQLSGKQLTSELLLADPDQDKDPRD